MDGCLENFHHRILYPQEELLLNIGELLWLSLTYKGLTLGFQYSVSRREVAVFTKCPFRYCASGLFIPGDYGAAVEGGKVPFH